MNIRSFVISPWWMEDIAKWCKNILRVKQMSNVKHISTGIFREKIISTSTSVLRTKNSTPCCQTSREMTSIRPLPTSDVAETWYMPNWLVGCNPPPESTYIITLYIYILCYHIIVELHSHFRIFHLLTLDPNKVPLPALQSRIPTSKTSSRTGHFF